MPDLPFSAAGDGVYLRLHVHPGAKRSGFNGRFGSACKLDLQSPPVDGKANTELLRFLSETFKLSKSALTLVSGASSRDKVVHLSGITPEKIQNIIK